MGVPQNRWFIVENPIDKGDDWGTPIYGNPHVVSQGAYRKSVVLPGQREGTGSPRARASGFCCAMGTSN